MKNSILILTNVTFNKKEMRKMKKNRKWSCTNKSKIPLETGAREGEREKEIKNDTYEKVGKKSMI